jgi:hypothetical protein
LRSPKRHEVSGHDFSRAASAAKSTWASQAAEKLNSAWIRERFVSGHDFSRAANAAKSAWASAPEGTRLGSSMKSTSGNPARAFADNYHPPEHNSCMSNLHPIDLRLREPNLSGMCPVCTHPNRPPPLPPFPAILLKRSRLDAKRPISTHQTKDLPAPTFRVLSKTSHLQQVEDSGGSRGFTGCGKTHFSEDS